MIPDQLTNSGQKLERRVKDILDKNKGKKFSWKSKQFVLLNWAKPMGQKTGETKTDFFLVLQEANSEKIETVAISGKQKNMSAVHNKLTAMWCESIYGKNWKKHMSKQIKSIMKEDGFHKDKLVDFKNKIITLGFRHEIMYEPDSGRERGAKTKPDIAPAVFWGKGCPIEYRDGKMGGKNNCLSAETRKKLKETGHTYNDDTIIKNSGIPDWIIKADEGDVNTIEDIMNNLKDIKKFVKDYKDDLIDAFYAHNYRIDVKVKCRHCGKEHRERYGNVMEGKKITSLKKKKHGDRYNVQPGKCPYCKQSGNSNTSEPIQGVNRSMAVHVKWSIKNGKLDGVLVLDKNHETICETVLVELRNCLLKLGIPDDSDFDIQMLKGKVTERTKNNLVKEDLLKML